MRFIVSSSALYNCLQNAGRVINAKNTINILDCFLFDIQGNQLTLTASDSENTLVATMELVESDSDMRLCINAKTILDSMKEIADQPLTFTINPDNLEISATYQNGHFNIMGESADAYPQINVEQDGMNTLTLSADLVLNGINRGLFATADDEMRRLMNGIYFDIRTDSLTIVTSDGHKLVRNRNYSVHADEPSSFILPRKPALILKNLLPKESGDITIHFNSQNAIVNMESARLVCRLVEGRYPNYDSVIPASSPLCATVDRLTLLSAMRRVLIFSSQSLALIKLHFEDNKVVVSAQDVDYSKSAEEVVQCVYDGQPISIGFNGSFLVDILNNTPGENVNILMADPGRSGLVVPVEQGENEDLVMLLMPMMLGE